LIIHHYLVKRFGFAPAAIIGLLDFLDRAQPRPGMPLASRARIIAELEGIIGKNAIDQALKSLVDAGVIKKIKNVAPGQKNLTVFVEYSLCPEVLVIRDSRNRESRELPEAGPDSDPDSGVPYINSSKEEEKEAACSAAAAPQQSSAGPSSKRRRVRATGIVTWTQDDETEACRIEKDFAADDLAAAVQSVRSSGRDPLPGLVSAELERRRRRREADAAAQARRAASAAPHVDLKVVERGKAFIESIRRRRLASEAS
jgi:hypothetical protein